MTDEQINAFFEMVKVLLAPQRKLSAGAIKEVDEIAALARIGSRVKPRPISEAPKDGTLIDIYLSFIRHDGRIESNNDGRFPDCYWNAEAEAWEGETMRHRETYDVSQLEEGQSGLIVTHWTPRPPPPEQQETK